MYISLSIYIYIHGIIYIHLHIHIYIYAIHIHPVPVRRFPSSRTQPLENLTRLPMNNGFLSDPAPGENILSGNLVTVSFHNFKSQNFKLSVSNPESKSVAYLSVLSQISNCQSLGRKNKHEILKTDRKRKSCYGDRVYAGIPRKYYNALLYQSVPPE